MAVGRVILPTDSADATTRRKYAEYGASRHERTLAPQDVRRQADAVRPRPDRPAAADHRAARAERALHSLTELRAELPYEFGVDDYEQILHDIAQLVAPALGWRPAPTLLTGRGWAPTIASSAEGRRSRWQ